MTFRAASEERSAANPDPHEYGWSFASTGNLWEVWPKFVTFGAFVGSGTHACQYSFARVHVCTEPRLQAPAERGANNSGNSGDARSKNAARMLADEWAPRLLGLMDLDH